MLEILWHGCYLEGFRHDFVYSNYLETGADPFDTVQFLPSKMDILGPEHGVEKNASNYFFKVCEFCCQVFEFTVTAELILWAIVLLNNNNNYTVTSKLF